MKPTPQALQHSSRLAPDPIVPVPRPRREVGPVGTMLALVSKGVRTSVAQVGRHADWWDSHNVDVMSSISNTTRPRWWAVLGDSTAQGVGADSTAGGWVVQLAARLDDPPPMLNLSVSGAKTGDLIEIQIPRFDALVEELGPPEIVTVAVGSNDVSFSPNPARLARNLEEITRRLPAGSVLSALPQVPIGGLAKVANARLGSLAEAHDHIVADLNSHYRWPYRHVVAADRFHPNDAGYALWAEAFADAVSRSR